MYQYRASVVRIVDGDTLECDADLGFNITLRLRIRLLGINAPELNTPEGKLSKSYVVGVINTLGRVVLLDTVKVDKFGGRWDAKVTLSDNSVLNELMVTSGHAVVKEYSDGRPA